MERMVGLFEETEMQNGVAHDLAGYKQELHKMSEQEGRIVEVGTLSGGENEQLWNQGANAISLRRRLETGEVTEAEVNEGVSRLNQSFVRTTPGAAKRCVDGSTIEGYDDADPAWYGRPLGPQVQGGTADEAVAMRLTKGFTEDETSTLLSDIEEVVSAGRSEYAPGDHTDDHANEEKSGCGAVDGQVRKLPRYNDPEHAAVIKATADTIFGRTGLKPKEGAFEAIQASAAAMAAQPDYLPSAQGFLAKLRELNPNGVEKLIRPHAEVSLTLNFVEGTTFHRDHFNAQTGSKIQNFNLDVWAIIKEYGQDGYALIVDAVATVMDLTDGSLRLYARLPAEQQADVPQAA